MSDLPEKRYLADGVYASYDGFQLWLETLEGHRIALESETYGSLLEYVEYIKEWNERRSALSAHKPPE